MTTLNTLQLARGIDTVIESFALSGSSNYDLPTTSVRSGQMIMVVNETSNSSQLTVRASDATTVDTMRLGHCLLIALQSAPTTSTHWKVVNIYEEGAWTPTVAMQTADFTSITYTLQKGYYLRNNRNVTCHFEVTWSAASGGSGICQIKSIPFTTHPNALNQSTATLEMSNIPLGAGFTLPLVVAPNNSAFFQLRQAMNGATTAAAGYIPAASYNSGSFNKIVIGTISYIKA